MGKSILRTGYVYLVFPRKDALPDPNEPDNKAQQFYTVECLGHDTEGNFEILDGKIINQENPRYKNFSEEFYTWTELNDYVRALMVDFDGLRAILSHERGI